MNMNRRKIVFFLCNNNPQPLHIHRIPKHMCTNHLVILPPPRKCRKTKVLSLPLVNGLSRSFHFVWSMAICYFYNNIFPLAPSFFLFFPFSTPNKMKHSNLIRNKIYGLTNCLVKAIMVDESSHDDPMPPSVYLFYFIISVGNNISNKTC